MSVLTLPAQPGQDTTARPVPWRRMAWVTWRQHRATLVSVTAVLGGFAVFLVIFGLKVHHDYAMIANCPLAGQNQSSTCARLISNFNSFDWPLANACSILMQLAPVLIGAFAGAPLLARELENGTYRYAWTQGLPRERQAIAKLALLGVTLAVLAGAFGELFAWFFRPFLYVEEMNVLTETAFDSHGLVFPAFALVSFAIGAFLGMLFRRIIPAIVATLGVYLALRLAAWGARTHYPVAVVTSNVDILNGSQSPGSPGFTWILGTWFTGPGGQPASQSVINQYLDNSNSNSSLPPGYTEWYRFVPSSRFWPMQFMEAGWLVVLAVALMAGTVWLVRRRAA
jgi:ABC-type transport system involved in multi-copper enzyme maturation permease subunit